MEFSGVHKVLRFDGLMMHVSKGVELTAGASPVPAPFAVVSQARQMQQHPAKRVSSEPRLQATWVFIRSVLLVCFALMKLTCIHGVLFTHWLEPV
jgi:hypothetical protein